MRSLITKDIDICHYCKYIEDRKDMWIKITESESASWYCLMVKDRPEVRKYIKDSYILWKLDCEREIEKIRLEKSETIK